jgi:predicted nucleic acid-binding protein
MHNEIIVTDSGPIIHLSQINTEFAWKIFTKIYVPNIVHLEVTKFSLPGSNIFKDKRFKINTSNKNILEKAKKLHKKHEIGKNDSIILAHAKSLEADLLLTDDLELRELASSEKIKPVGSVGILYRSFIEGYCDLKQLFKHLDSLFSKSSLYITKDLIQNVKNSALDYNKK